MTNIEEYSEKSTKRDIKESKNIGEYVPRMF